MFIYDASLQTCDNDRDLFVEVIGADEALLAEDGSVLNIPVQNPPAAVLLEAVEAIAALFERSGHRLMALERSHWQLKIGVADLRR
ncbi:hypothetical protein Z949_1903 [Sulfitobacter guttiformis KCTC 32187]|nr:hypothetical protein Z949_1903 [Sulfitobacter guttiformis KCTC 32187]